MTGIGDITKRGRILNYDTEPVLNFWEKGSKCDAIEGAWDSSTIPTKITKDMELDIFIALMCRKSLMVYEKVGSLNRLSCLITSNTLIILLIFRTLSKTE